MRTARPVPWPVTPTSSPRRSRAAGTRRHRVERGDVDSLAAAIILERWLRGEY